MELFRIVISKRSERTYTSRTANYASWLPARRIRFLFAALIRNDIGFLNCPLQTVNCQLSSYRPIVKNIATAAAPIAIKVNHNRKLDNAPLLCTPIISGLRAILGM